MSSDAGDKVRVRVEEDVEFLLTQEQLRIMEITPKEGDSFYSCVTSCNENSFEEFDSAISLIADKAEKSYVQEYEDITPVPSENETTPTASFVKGPSGTSFSHSSKEGPSPRKLEAIALASARFNLIHPPNIQIIPATPLKVSNEAQDETPQNLDALSSDCAKDIRIDEKVETAISDVARTEVEQSHDGAERNAVVPAATLQANSIPAGKMSLHLRIETKPTPARSIRPPTKSCQFKENCERVMIPKSSPLDASLDINVMSSKLMKNQGPRKLQQQSFKGSPVQLSKLVTPKKSKVTSKVAEFIRTGTSSTKKKEENSPSLRDAPAASRIPKKCFIQSARLFGKQIVPENLMKSPKPLITMHKHVGTDKSRQIHINESTYETFEAVAAKK